MENKLEKSLLQSINGKFELANQRGSWSDSKILLPSMAWFPPPTKKPNKKALDVLSGRRSKKSAIRGDINESNFYYPKDQF